MNRKQMPFTLIELLVVVAIIAVLASLLLPALTSARSRAIETSCLGQQKQLYLAVVLYSDEFDGSMPAPWPYEYTMEVLHQAQGATGLGALYRDRYLSEGRLTFCPSIDAFSPNSTYTGLGAQKARTLTALEELGVDGTTSQFFYSTQTTYRVNPANTNWVGGMGGPETDARPSIYSAWAWQSRPAIWLRSPYDQVAGLGSRFQNNQSGGALYNRGSVGSPPALLACAFPTNNRWQYRPHNNAAANAVYMDGVAGIIRVANDPGLVVGSSLFTATGSEHGKFATSVNVAYPGTYLPPTR